MEGGTNGQAASGAAAWSCLVRSFRWQTVRSGFWGCEGVVVCREGVSHQCCAGWLQGLSFFVVCWEMVWHRRCAGCGWGEFFCGLS